MIELNDYPPGVQDLLRWAKFHLEELDKLELEFREWQVAQESTLSTEVIALMLPTRAEQARQRWEARVRALQKEV